MKVSEAIDTVSARLEQAGLEDASLESEYLVAAVLGVARAQLVLERAQSVPDDQASTLDQWATARAERWPLAYVLGNQPFGDLLLKVSPAVLIPRPETEAWVADLMTQLKSATRPITAVDVGTGSGAIALTLSQHPRIKTVYGIDVSADALEVARENAALYDRAGTCTWIQGDLLQALPAEAKPNLVVANLPYIATSEMDGLPPEVLREPRTALDGGVRGDEVIERLIDQAEKRLPANAALWLEIGFDQAEIVSRRLRDGQWATVTVDLDLAGHPRLVRATRGEPLWTY